MPRHLSVKILFTMRGFYLGEGPIFASEDRLKPRRLLHSIIGVQLTDGRIAAAKNAIAAAFCKLFELAIELKELFIALRGHRSFFETLAPRWNEQIHDKVSVDDLIMLVNFWTMARRNHRGAASARFKMSDLVDEWIVIVDTVEGLEPLTTATVVVAGQPNAVAGVTAELENVAFGDHANTANELSEPWPPAHFQGSDRAYLIDNKVKHKLQGINTAFFGPSGPPELPNKRTALVDIKLFVAYWALRNTKPDNLWSLFVVPVGPFWSATDRDQWKSLTGNCSKDLATLNGFVRRTKIAFGGGKSTMIALLALWMGSVEQVEAAASASNIVDNPTKIWSQKCPRQGIAIALRKITVDGEQKMECILYDPTMNCPRLRGESWVKGALVHLFALRQRIKDEVHKAFDGQIVRTWVGGKVTDLEGEPDSVEMSAAFIRSVTSTDALDPFDMDEEDWRRDGFVEMN